MGERYDVKPGAEIGRWTVLEECAGKSPRAWKCRCACGVEREVPDRGLRYGGSMSCGCLRAERASEENAYELKGKRFGRLVVEEQAEGQDRRRGRWWRCRCECGREIVVSGTQLASGRKTSCGCCTERKYAYADITGMKFHRLTALYPLKERSVKGGVMWQCRCECGREVRVAYSDLMYSNMRSCGCQKKEHDRALGGYLERVDGTSISHLRSRKTPKNNTTGVRGVYMIKGKYVAKIVFQKKQYFLGAYESLSDAAEARTVAEQEINGRVTDFYDRWKARADRDPDWAKQNPMRISVERRDSGLQVRVFPRI